MRGIPPMEARLTPAPYPLLCHLFTLLLQLNPNAVADALEQTIRIVDDVDRRIADGRRFLWGDGATLADLAFATAMAPLLLPDGYTAPIPTYAQNARRAEATHRRLQTAALLCAGEPHICVARDTIARLERFPLILEHKLQVSFKAGFDGYEELTGRRMASRVRNPSEAIADIKNQDLKLRRVPTVTAEKAVGRSDVPQTQNAADYTRAMSGFGTEEDAVAQAPAA
jgi:hypothetical protein